MTVENLAPCRRLIRVEVEPQAVEAAFDKVTAEFHRMAKFPGFRPGKAPKDLVTRTYAKQIETEAKRKLTSEHYRKAIQEQKLRIVGSPELEDIQFGRGMPMQFAITAEIVPDYTLPEYKGIPVRRPEQTVTEADVEQALEVLRAQQASYKDVSRPVQPGDFVVVNYSGTSEGKALTEFAPTARGITQQSNFWLHVQPDSFVPGFTDQLIGANAGEHRTVQVTFPPDFVAPQLAGKAAVYQVEVVQVKEKILPELNDEFAKSYQADDLEKLRAGVRRDLQNELEWKIRRSERNQIVRYLLDRVQIELPESLVMGETRSVIDDILRENQQRGVPNEAIEQRKDEIFAAANNSAKDRVKAAVILGDIAEKEGIKVEERELALRISQLAEQNKIKPDKFVKQLQERNGIPAIQEQIQTAKTLDFLEKHAQIVPG